MTGLWSVDSACSGVLFKPAYARVAGDVAAGVVLSQVVYWFRPDAQGRPRTRAVYDGELWFSQSYAEWEASCALSQKQMTRVLRALEAQGILRLRTITHNNSPRVLVQLCESRLVELVCQHVAPPQRPTVDVTPPDGMCDTDQRSMYKEETALETGEETDMKAADALKAFDGKGRPERLNLIWAKTLSEVRGGFIRPHTIADLSMFKRLGKLAGERAPTMVEAVVRDWAGFCILVAQARGLGRTPDVPTLPFLAKHLDLAMEFLAKVEAEARPRVRTPVTIPVHAPTPSLPVVTERPASIEEIEQILRETE